MSNMPTLDADENVVQGLVKLCQQIHLSVAQMTKKYRDEMSRHNYVTPTSYLELLNIFSKIFDKKKAELVLAKKRTKTGLDKLLATEKDVAKLRIELNDMLPLLDQAVHETNETMAKIAEDTSSTEEIKTKVASEEEQVMKKVQETRAIASEASERLAEATPALEMALQSLQVLSKNDIQEVRALQRPPQGVKLTIEAVCILKQVDPMRVPVAGVPGKKEDDYWEPGRGLLNDAGKFLQSLQEFDKENIPEIVIQKLQKHIDSPDFDPIKIERTSKACKSLCMWCRAMHSFYMINKEVAPRKEALANAESELAIVKEVLATKKRELKKLEEGLRTLQVKYEDAVRKKTEYETKVDECNQRILRAERVS
jgi:dynein heavy chain, axonemal